MFKQRVRKRNFRGVHWGKSKAVNFCTSDQQIDVLAEQLLYLTPKTVGNAPPPPTGKCSQVEMFENVHSTW